MNAFKKQLKPEDKQKEEFLERKDKKKDKYAEKAKMIEELMRKYNEEAWEK